MKQNNRGLVGPTTKVRKIDIITITKPFINRMKMEGKSKLTIKAYSKALERLLLFHELTHPLDLSIDEVIDFFIYLNEVRKVKWTTNKRYVAALRYYWKEVLLDPDFASRIPYPREKASLPKILSREELKVFFNSCKNRKHRVIFKLMYGAGLRRRDLLNLRIEDIDTKDGKSRIRINNGKGGKDRYTVLPKTLIQELRSYYLIFRPEVYLFNGKTKGEKLSEGGLSHALRNTKKASGLTKDINLHILRHCFASHAMEDGMNIKTLQFLLGHSTVQTTMIYLHISDVPLTNAFSPLDKWDGNE